MSNRKIWILTSVLWVCVGAYKVHQDDLGVASACAFMAVFYAWLVWVRS